MKKILPLVLVAAAIVVGIVLWPGGSKGPEPIAYGRDTCAECRMIASQPGYGGEILDARGQLSKYDDIGCLLGAWKQAGAGDSAWVEAHGGEGFVPATEAFYVVGSKVATPMASAMLAFRDEVAAKAFAAEQGGSLKRWAELTAGGAVASVSTAAAAHGEGAAMGFTVEPGGKRPFNEEQARAGKAAFIRECSACHGERGDGEGNAAAFLDPRPRNLTRPIFKLRTTESGQPPTTSDIWHSIERGLPGSAMPAFSFLEPEEKRLITAYVLNLADLIDGKEPVPIADPGAPPPVTPESIAQGKDVYEKMKCASCHGELGRGDGADQLKDDAGRPIVVRDFTNGVFRGGSERKDLYYRFMTGMDGSPMPSYADSIAGGDRWALVDYVMSLRVEPAAVVRPSDPIAAGREVAEKYSCRGCHILDDGKGGDTGPDLRIAATKLNPAWVRKFLKSPRAVGKIYPWRPHRMPHLGLDDEEVDVLARYLAAVAKKKDEPIVVPDIATFPADRVAQGKNFYVLKCAQCHQLGKAVETPPATQQGPDLINVAARIEYQWSQEWMLDPKKVDPQSKMTNPGMTPAEVESMSMFVWKASVEAGGALAAPR